MSGARPFRMVARMPDDVPRDMRHLSKQFPGLRTFIPSNPREGRRCSLYAASERPRPCCDQHRLILLPTSPVAGKFSARGDCGPVLGPARYRLAGGPTGRRPVRCEGARPTGQMAEGRTAGTRWRISESRGLDGAVLDGAVLDGAVLDGAVLDGGAGWHGPGECGPG